MAWATSEEMKAEIERLHAKLAADIQKTDEACFRLLLVEKKLIRVKPKPPPRQPRYDSVGADWRKSHDENGVPIREIARQVGLHPSTVLRRIRRARLVLKRLAAEVDVGGPARRAGLDPE